MKKETLKAIILTAVITALITCGTSTVIAYTVNSNNVNFRSADSAWKVNTVAEAIDDLYIKKTGDNYSTDERVVGTWIDGKPIYQRSFLVTEGVTVSGNSTYARSSLPGFSDVYVSDVLPTLDSLIDAYVLNSYDSTHDFYDVPAHIRIQKNNGYIVTWDNPGVEYIGYMISKDAVITIQYTKTTDQVQSNEHAG